MFESLRFISDHQILNNTDAIVAQDRKLTLRLLVHLHEIERRKLYLKHGFSSMFDYCTTHLRLSEPAAVRRIRTARCLVRFPRLYPFLESGEVNLMSISLIARVLKPENADLLIERIRGKSKREVEAIVAECEPRTLLPPDRVRTVVIPVVATARADSLETTVTGDGKKSATIESDRDQDHRADGTRTSPSVTVSSEIMAKPERHAVVQFTAREEFMRKVERARALVWHQLPGATFEQLFELALDELIERRDPVAREERRRKRHPATKRASAEEGRRYVSAAVRDQVFARDQRQCAFVGTTGRRCASTVGLQLDHIRPVARGGASTLENLRVLCAQHNRLEAERVMGRSGPPERSHAP
jgi:5-methylcytosine-specific restriction endonuclease McrA